jgi:fermentation-respiration switch protein FrsA (DUF1100 family)
MAAIAAGTVLAYLFICLAMWAMQRQLLYVPDTRMGPPSSYGLAGFDEVGLTAEDGTRLTAWVKRADPGRPTLLYFHGNAGNLGSRSELFEAFAGKGFGVVGLSYRGYGSSEGSPSETGLYADARAALAYARGTLGVPAGALIYYGESLGTGVAVETALAAPPALLVLQSPYTSIEALAGDRYFWLPVRLLLADRFDSVDKIARVEAPLLVFHGEKDAVVPVRYGRALVDAAREPKEAIYFPDLGHGGFDSGRLAEAVDAAFAGRRGAHSAGGVLSRRAGWAG